MRALKILYISYHFTVDLLYQIPVKYMYVCIHVCILDTTLTLCIIASATSVFICHELCTLVLFFFIPEILSQYVPHDSLCLEMFARNLTPHWTSWGNEVLSIQCLEL